MRQVLVTIFVLAFGREALADHPRVFAGEIAPQLGLAAVAYDEAQEGGPGGVWGHSIFALGLGGGRYVTERVAVLIRVRGSLAYSFEYGETLARTWFTGPAIRVDVGTSAAVQVGLGWGSNFYERSDSLGDSRGIGILLRAELVRGNFALGLESQPMLYEVSRDALRIIDLAVTAGVRH